MRERWKSLGSIGFPSLEVKRVKQDGPVHCEESGRTAAEVLSRAKRVTRSGAFRRRSIVAGASFTIRAASALTINDRAIVPSPDEIRKPSEGGKVRKRTPACSILHRCSSSHRARNKNFLHTLYNHFYSTQWNSSRSLAYSSLFVMCKDRDEWSPVSHGSTHHLICSNHRRLCSTCVK